METSKMKAILYWVLAGILTGCYWIAGRMLANETGILFGMNYNLVSYVMILGGVYLLFLAGILLMEKTGKRFSADQGETGRFFAASGIAGLALTVLAAVFLYLVYTNEGKLLGFSAQYLRNVVPSNGYALAMAAMFGVMLTWAWNEKDAENNTGRAAFCAFAAVICAICCYAPAPFLDEGGTLYHTHAYTNSIVHVAQGEPFDDYNVSVYGHYALLYLPFVKLLGNNYHAIAISIFLAALVTYGAIFWACQCWIRKTSTLAATILAIAGIPLMLYVSGQYYQVNPHRLLFPALAILHISRVLRSKKKHGEAGLAAEEILLAALAVLWNLETGLFTAAVLTVFRFLRLWQKQDGVRAKDAVFEILKCAGGIIVALLLAYAAVNIYSFLNGAKGWMSIERFVYPLTNKSYIAYMRWQIPGIFSVYLIQIVLFSVGVFQAVFALMEKAKGKKTDTGREILLGCVSVSGLASLVYFMNRTAYANISASWMQMALALGLIADGAVKEVRERWQGKKNLFTSAGKIVCLLFLFCFGMETALSAEKAIEKRAVTSWHGIEMKNAADWIKENVPEGTTGIGTGVPELFYEAGRNAGCTVIDCSDLWIDAKSMERAQETIRNGDGYLFIESSIPETLDVSGYEIIKTAEFGKNRYDLYIREGKNQ